MVVELEGFEIELVDVVDEVEDNVLAVVVNWAHDEVRGSDQVSELVELVFVKFVDVGFLVLLVVPFSSENEHSVEIKGDDSHSVLSNIDDVNVLQNVLEFENGPS